MNKFRTSETAMITPDISSWLDIFVLSDGRVLLNMKRGIDVTRQLEMILREHGVICHENYKSPCG